MGFDSGYGVGSLKPGVCTSTTRPTNPYTGQTIYETDTLLAKVWTGSAWVDYPQGKANTASPTFTGTVVLPSTTSVGAVTGTEISYLAGVTSMVQTQLNAKAPVVSPSFTGGAQVAGNIQQNVVHGHNVKLDLSSGNNGAGTGQAVLALWVSEPGATWTGAGIARNRVNTGGTFPRVNTGLSAQMIRFTETTNGGVEITCTSSSSVEAYFTFDSAGNAYKAGGGSWSAPSDVRLKENIRDYDKGTAELMQIRVREWEHNGKGGLKEGSSGFGVIADEIELILPNTVQTYEGKLNPSDEETTDIKAVNPTEITWLLVKTVQEQQAVIQNLQARIAILEGGTT